MATYTELLNEFTNDDLRQRVQVACVVWAQATLEGTPTAEQKDLADMVIRETPTFGRMVLKLVLAANKSVPIANILSATDAAIQANVDAVIGNLAGA